ncbi:MAG: hypothetical protein ACYDC6_14795 [Acidobacteriaceae bacterium]
MSFTSRSVVGSSRNRTESLSVVSPLYALALLLLALCASSGIVGCGLTNGRQHGLGPGTTSGGPITPVQVPPNTPTVMIASAANPTTNMVYVVDSGNPTSSTPVGTFYAISGASNSVVATVPGLSQPVAVDVNSQTGTIYIANAGNNTVSVVSGSSNAITATISVGNDPSAVVVNPATNMVYVANSKDGTVTVIDGATNAATATVPTLGHGIDLMAVDSGLNQIYVGSNQGYAEAITVLNGVTNGVAGTLNLKNAPQAIAVDSANHILYAESNETTVTGVTTTSQIDIFDEGTETSLGTISLSGFVDSMGLAFNSATGYLYAANNTTSAIDVLKEYSEVGTVPYATSGTTVDSVSVNTATNRVYSVYSANNFSTVGVLLIDGESNSTVTTLPLQ